MQRLEVSGAVRPLYGSLGVKGLMSQIMRKVIKIWGEKKKKKPSQLQYLAITSQISEFR